MNKWLVILCIIMCFPVYSKTLEGSIQVNKQDINEGHIGVRLSLDGGVSYVHPESPAEKAGIQKRDVIIEVNGKRHNLDAIIGIPGTEVHLNIRRNLEMYSVDVERVDYHLIKK